MKDYREKELKWYIFAYLFLMIGISSPGLITSGSNDWFGSIEKLLSSSLLAGVICSLAFVFDCLYTAELKDLLLCLGFTTLPGKTVFTRISKDKISDMRIDVNEAKEKYKDVISALPSDKKGKKKYENTKWYSLSRIHEDDPRVKTAHRDYLLSRDLYTTTITMFVLTAAGMGFKVIQFSWIPVAYLIAMLILTNVATHFRAHRFVNSVIAVDMNPKKEKEKQPEPKRYSVDGSLDVNIIQQNGKNND